MLSFAAIATLPACVQLLIVPVELPVNEHARVWAVPFFISVTVYWVPLAGAVLKVKEIPVIVPAFGTVVSHVASVVLEPLVHALPSETYRAVVVQLWLETVGALKVALDAGQVVLPAPPVGEYTLGPPTCEATTGVPLDESTPATFVYRTDRDEATRLIEVVQLPE